MIRWELMSLGLKIKTTCQVDSLGFQARKFVYFFHFQIQTDYPQIRHQDPNESIPTRGVR